MNSINLEERENLCKAIASIFSSPEAETIEEFQNTGALTFFQEAITSLGGSPLLSDGTPPLPELQTFFPDWPDEYERLFAGLDGLGVSLVESFYKPWTLDPNCHLSFAREKGLLQGDPALHVSALYQHCGMEVAEEFETCPDHLAVELEFLSLLYRCATDREIKIFIADHLDWVPLLKQELSRFRPYPAYTLAMELLDLFLKREKERLMII
jgi:putative dimethyl sulfoxide reductase chaperone